MSSSKTTAPRGTQLLPLYVDLPLELGDAACHRSGLLGTDLHNISSAGFVETETRISSYCCTSAEADLPPEMSVE